MQDYKQRSVNGNELPAAFWQESRIKCECAANPAQNRRLCSSNCTKNKSQSLINCIDIQSEQQGAFLVIIGICSPRRTNWTDQIIPWTPCCNLSFEIDQETDKTMLVPLNIPRLTFEYYIYFVA